MDGSDATEVSGLLGCLLTQLPKNGNCLIGGAPAAVMSTVCGRKIVDMRCFASKKYPSFIRLGQDATGFRVPRQSATVCSTDPVDAASIRRDQRLEFRTDITPHQSNRLFGG